MTKSERDFRSHLGFDERVTSKIVTAQEATARIGAFPRERQVVMAHGTFDLVHPGHLRHLAFAKSRGDVLVVSITTDEYVLKANMRPYVPEELRALNLAALELVDLVIVDSNPEPLNLITLIQPDIFVKGYEYGKEGQLPEKTLLEKAAVEAYGGRIVFSPGDFVLSSSVLIDNDPPDIGLEKLLTLMEVEALDFADLRSALAGAETLNLTILGDLIVDAITSVSVIGGHRKTPTPSVRVDQRERFVGGAGIVAKHMAAAGARVRFHTVVGDDEVGRWAVVDLLKSGIDLDAVVDSDRPTTFKDAVVADGYRLLRLDDVDNETIGPETRARFMDGLSQASDAVVLSDFRHGIFNKETIPSFLSAIGPGVFKVADSQVASRWGNILDFRGCDLITPNEQEVRFALGDQDSVVRPLGSELYQAAECKVLMLKLGARGMLTFRDPALESRKRSFFSIDAITRRPILDAVGSGDALLAYATVTHLTTGNEVIASIVGTVAAGLACEQEGNVPIPPAAVLARIDELEKAASFAP